MPVEGDYSLSDFAALAGVTLNEGVKDAYKAGYDNYNSLSAYIRRRKGRNKAKQG